MCYDACDWFDVRHQSYVCCCRARASTTWRDMKVVNDHVFIISESNEHGMQVFDLTQLRDLSADNTRVSLCS